MSANGREYRVAIGGSKTLAGKPREIDLDSAPGILLCTANGVFAVTLNCVQYLTSGMPKACVKLLHPNGERPENCRFFDRNIQQEPGQLGHRSRIQLWIIGSSQWTTGAWP